MGVMLSSSVITRFCSAAAVLLAVFTVACSGQPSGPSNAATSSAQRCTKGDNLLLATDFMRVPEQRYPWRGFQHARRSFSVDVDDGVLTVTQIASEPWFYFAQSLKDTGLAGRTVEFSADLKGNIIAEPKFHAWDHVGGLYYSVKKGRERLNTRIAEHEPNQGEWDWQRVSVEFTVPEDATELLVGFTHQAKGWFKARNPSLRVIECR